MPAKGTASDLYSHCCSLYEGAADGERLVCHLVFHPVMRKLLARKHPWLGVFTRLLQDIDWPERLRDLSEDWTRGELRLVQNEFEKLTWPDTMEELLDGVSNAFRHLKELGRYDLTVKGGDMPWHYAAAYLGVDPTDAPGSYYTFVTYHKRWPELPKQSTKATLVLSSPSTRSTGIEIGQWLERVTVKWNTSDDVKDLLQRRDDYFRGE